MRLLIDILTALTLACLISGTMWFTKQHKAEEQAYDELRAAVGHIQQQIAVQAALGQVARTPQGYPERIDPEWFDGGLPVNDLLNGDHPWLEIAAAGELDLDHPLIRVATDPSVAGFWYNPRRGVVRARVPQRLSDEATLALYNRVNGASLDRLQPMTIDFSPDIARTHAAATRSKIVIGPAAGRKTAEAGAGDER